jgi:hypothetical protein
LTIEAQKGTGAVGTLRATQEYQAALDGDFHHLRIRAHISLGYERSEVKIILPRRKSRRVPWQNLDLTLQKVELAGEKKWDNDGRENKCARNQTRTGNRCRLELKSREETFQLISR